MKQRTLVLLKPDAVNRRLMGEIISRFEKKGLKIVAMKMLWMSRERAEKHYEVHKDKPFYESLIDYITSGPIVAMVLEGDRAIEVVRKMMGKTNGIEAEPGTIRGDFAMSIQNNLVHGSDSEESAKREIPIFFDDSEILEYRLVDEVWI
ncbi:nucleoside-diphosphate kinase [Candidatus Aciduliprofundum boonei]|uniref:Nucleoside diphosphate kinase n=1 Tax=Aciduliprofundum boonei (strain DSM 19572 / T469) TaxID=439481 RepID=D3TAB8_ACIB4|nr:nucleoside-diphosphate kinase [Candidatus Aciduliprofundum boonei]ADD09047.1 Nucleoside-diphosphate kinase [Aciduliprofundum boonei T469]HII54438.1 nucleoside-diphosphate kinase [Candidatus Aciduliprofundum boonei]